MSAEEIYGQIIKEVPTAKKGKLFGAPSIKTLNGENVAFLWKDKMTFKLDEESQQIALKLKGSTIGTHLYDEDKQMKAWVSIPKTNQHEWKRFTELALNFASQLKK